MRKYSILFHRAPVLNIVTNAPTFDNNVKIKLNSYKFFEAMQQKLLD